MPTPWRALGLTLLLAFTAACALTTGTPVAPTPTTRPSFTPPAARTTTPTAPAATDTAAAPTATETLAADPSTPDPNATVGVATLPPDGTPAGIVTATPTAGPCTNDVEYIADLTVPDGTQFLPGEAFVKQWSVRNAGTCDWDAGYRLVLVSGNALGARSELALYPARAGLEAIIEVPMLAPAEPGAYTGRWQARDPVAKHRRLDRKQSAER